ncbi:sulfite exporter TauE/SafE family protein [Nibricoccus sp. IMCC34717]|uniref:sulfite exporter TauE/SafE family protein n=1 Tax=Nibricoccus sp. IMCC34717 TaxID=3034021 RepID=UPI00384DE914
MSGADLLALFLLALAGAGHCAGMCGGFAVAATASVHGRRGFWQRLALYHVAKTLSYFFVALILLLVLERAWAGGWIDDMRRVLGGLVAVCLVGLGLYQISRQSAGAWFNRWLSPRDTGCGVWSLGALPPLRAFLVGWINGLIPCGLSLAAILLVLRFRSLPEIGLGLFVFGLGTLPVLGATAWLGSRISARARERFLVVSGWLLVALGVVTALRISPAGAAWLHQVAGAWLGLPADPWCR